MDIARTFDLLADVPAGKIVVSESGISTREQIEELERVGVDAVLVGSAVMAADDPEAAVARSWVRGRAVGRAAVTRYCGDRAWSRPLPSSRWRRRLISILPR